MRKSEQKANDILRLCYEHFQRPRSDKRNRMVERQIENIINGKKNPYVVPPKYRMEKP
jgi:hypothetical protein